jgi:DNA-binding response OmpR family regulator
VSVAAKSILVVDDQFEIRDVTSAVLGNAGYRVETLASGAAALERLDGDPVDLLLLDIDMPEMDGWETLRLLRSDERLADLPVVMFSVKGAMRDKVTGLQEGAADYITKPFVVDELLSRVERLLDARTGDRSEREDEP